jgi:hypothetical protein
VEVLVQLPPEASVIGKPHDNNVVGFSFHPVEVEAAARPLA